MRKIIDTFETDFCDEPGEYVFASPVIAKLIFQFRELD